MKIKFINAVSSIHGPYGVGQEIEATEEFAKDMIKGKHAVALEVKADKADKAK